MATYNKNTCDIGSVQAGEVEYQDGLITFAGAGTLAAGTLLAQDTSTLKWVKYVKGGVTNGNGIPSAVLSYPVTATGAGDVKARAIIAGKVKKERLIIDADGNDSNIDNAVILAIRDAGIVPLFTTQLSVLDP